MWFKFFSAILLCLLSSCTGYQLGNSKPSKLSEIHTISVPLAKNDTQEQRLASMVTSSVVDAITRDGSYSIATDSEADADLHVHIQTITYSQRRTDRFDSLLASELYMQLVASWKLIDQQNQVLMSGSDKGLTYYTVDTNQQTSRRNAFPDAAKNLSEKIVQRIANGF